MRFHDHAVNTARARTDPAALAAARLAGRPLAIAPGRLEGLLASVPATLEPSSRLTTPAPFAAPVGLSVTDAGIAVIPITGPLVARGDWLTALFGALEYGEVAAAVETAARDPSVRGILLEVDSPGGEVGGLFDLVERIRDLKEITEKPVWAVASESALSAAYAISSAADRLYVTRTGEVGSVGVIAVHIDASGADAMAGLKWTLIHAGERKTDGNPHEPLTPRAHADIQADVDRLYDQFVGLAAANRGMAPESVHATEAAIYRGALAVDAGLADRVGTLDQALADLTAFLEPKPIRAGPRTAAHNTSTHPPTRTSAMNDPVRERVCEADAKHQADAQHHLDTGDLPVEDNEDATAMETADEQAVQPVAAASSPEPVSTAAVDADAVAAKLRAEYGEIAGIAAQAGQLGVDIDAADAMRRGMKPDALRRSVLDALAAKSEAADVVAVPTTAAATAGESPIVKRARERASAA
ncbi:MAG: S49 family peptidase [Rhodospirillales bacterium]|nr:S49 family peptidase [Rhodospirillales bacterium]